MSKLFNFDHSSSNFHDALGVPEEVDDKCRELIFYAVAHNYITKRDLYGDDEAITPKELSTRTGDLQKALSLATTDMERFYLLLLFKSVHEVASHSCARWTAFQMMDDGEKLKAKLFMAGIKKLLEMGGDDNASDDDQPSVSDRLGAIICAEEFLTKVNLINDKRPTFSEYLDLVKKSKTFKKPDINNPEEVDQYLDNLLKQRYE